VEDIDFSSKEPKLGLLSSYIRDRRIALELCPTSNLQTGIAKIYSDHPIGKLAKLKFHVTLNTDNRLMSNTSMSHEMQECVKSFGWNFADLQTVTVNALESSFIDHEDKLEIIEKTVKPAYSKISAE
jgi:adenosine deaminase